MLPLAERQSDFAAAIADPALPVPPGLVGPDGLSSARRFAVYRNNVAVALADALASNFPAVRKLVGDAFFRAMAVRYARKEPPSSPMLFEYGASFADFIQDFEPAASLPYLADVARIEKAWLDAYHAADAVALTSEDMAMIPEDEIAATSFGLHPSLRLVHSDFPAVTIWQTNAGDNAIVTLELIPAAEDALILRADTEVEVRLMPPGAFHFVETIAKGLSLERAAKAALLANPHFELSLIIRDLVSAGAFVSFNKAGLHETTSMGDLR